MTQPKYWIGTVDNCDVCDQPLTGDKMYDASVRGRWANTCRACFIAFRCTLGTGRGQEYTRQADGRWLKTGG